MKPKNPDHTKQRRPHLVLSLDMPEEIILSYEKRIIELGVTKKDYMINLVLKDLGLKYVPARYVPEDEKQITLE
jgi:hypothetical protein